MRDISTYQEAWYLDWEESERGWGVRPDGCSLHLSREEAEAYIKGYWAREKARNTSGQVPDEYERPSGKPYKVVVSPELHQSIEDEARKDDTRHGLRFWRGQIEVTKVVVAEERK